MFNKLSPLALAIAGVLSVPTMSVEAKATGEHEFVKDSMLVVFKDNTSNVERAEARRLVRGIMDDTDADGIDDKFARLMDGRLAKLSLGKGADVEKAIKMISQHPAVKYAEPNYIVRAEGMPDDPDFVSLWGLHNTGQNSGTADADIDALEAWDITTGSSDVIVGVIDTGVDYNHPDLKDNMWVNPGEIADNGIDDDGNGVIDDIHGYSSVNDNGDPMDTGGHGSHVAGTIGAKGNNGVGVVGVNWDVTIIGCQFLGSDGTGSTAGAISCIDYFTNLKENHGVEVVATNNSWGGGGFSQTLKDAIEAGGDAGILFVAAAGNDGEDGDATPHYPSSYDSDVVLSIASTDRNDELSIFSVGASNYGLTSVDMGAPGSAILSTTPNNNYSVYSGTSMATPQVTGAAALVWSLNPELTPVEMKQLLMDSGDANEALVGKTVAATRLNVANALENADPTPGYRMTVTPGSQTIVAGDMASYQYSLSSIAGWDGDVNLSLVSTPALEGASLSVDSASAGSDFTLNVATTAATPWGDYTLTVSGDNGEMQKSKAVMLSVLPQGLNDFSYGNDSPVSIPDNDDLGITSTIEVADELQVFGLTANIDVTHTWAGDIIAKLTSPSGKEVILHNKEGGNAQNIVKSWDLSDFNGDMAQGTWTLSVSDTADADTGTLNNWGMVISGLGDAAPAAPMADFSYVVTDLSVSFNNMSSDVNDDIVSYSWDFGDGAMSDEMSPTHSFAAAGSYSVTLMVTDAEGNTDSKSMSVDVFEHAVTASVDRARVSRRGSASVDLSWDGAYGESVVIYRDGNMVATTENDGRYRDRFRNAPASVEYKVCEASSSLCSDPMTVQF